MTTTYHINCNGNTSGPFTLSQLQNMWKNGSVTADALYWQEGFDEWLPITTMIDELEPKQQVAPIVRAYPQPHARATSRPHQQVIMVQASKSRGLYVILGLFLGCLGIHNFYAGYFGKGAAQLIITLLLGWIVIGFIITAIWALLEILVVDIDAAGNKMT